MEEDSQARARTRAHAPVDAVEVAEDLTVLLDHFELRRGLVKGVPTHTGY